ncbi:TPA: hypothetical protein ACH3X1_010369 [Trebouxia sp. C0004]
MLHEAPGGTSKQRKDAKVSAVFRRNGVNEHCAGINALASWREEAKLFTASKDSTVKRWGVSEQPSFEATYEGHSNWVNDITVLEDILVSCSSDTTVQFSKTDHTGEPAPIATFNQHTDYVNCLAAAKSAPIVASAGLRAEVFLWDVQKAMRINEQSGLYEAKPCEGHKGSVYALALSEPGNFMAAGSTDGAISIADTRSQSKLASLKGHTENVRALLLNADGTLLLSGSSDQTIRLWDLGQQRCIQTLAVHTDSVWSLLASHDFSVVYSGGRDRCVYRTQLANRTSELLLTEEAPINDMAFDGQSSALWVATASSAVRRWNVDESLPAAQAQPRASADLQRLKQHQQHQQPDNTAFLASTSTYARSRQAQDRPLQAQQQHATAQTRGIAPLVQSAVLTDRRHILTKDAEGNVELWDTATAAVKERFGQINFQQKEAELFAPQSILPWFAWDTKLGSLTLHLDSTQTFAAEVYAYTMGLQAPEEQKLNYGLEFLRGLFSTWADALQQQQHQQQQQQRVPEGDAQPEPPDPPQHPDSDGSSTSFSSSSPPTSSGQEPFQYTTGPYPPVIMCSLQGPGQPWDQQPWQKCVTKFTGQEPKISMIPIWVCRAVFTGEHKTVKETKAGFLLMPLQDSGLPSLLQSKLTAPRILLIYKVATYCQSKLAEQSYHMQLGSVYWDQAQQQEAVNANRNRQGDILELTCNGWAVPYDLSLAAVRQYIWKRSDDPVLHYGRQTPGIQAVQYLWLHILGFV